MRYYIYISLIAVLSLLCFNNALGQARTRFGGQGGATDSAFTMNQLLLKAYATATPNMFLKMTSTGHVVLAVPAGGGSGLVDSVTISNDSLFYWGGGVSFFVGIVNSGTTIDTTGLSDRIAYNLTRINNLSDTASLHADTLEAHKDWLSSIESEIAAIPTDTIPSWQATVDVDPVADSVLVEDNLYIGTTAERKPISIRVAGDSRDAVNEIPLSKIWTGRLANYLGATLDARLAVSGSFLMNQTPRYNPLNDTGSLMDIITVPGKIRNVAGLTDSVYYFIVTRGINDLHWYTTYDSGYNYTPENYAAALRTVMDSLTAWGYQVIIMGPKYVIPTSTIVIQDSVFRWIDTAKQIAADYNVPFFNAFTWQQSHGAGTLLSMVDNFHENADGHEVLFTGILHTMGYEVKRDGQKLANNGKAEFNSITLRTSDTVTPGSVPVFMNARGELVPGANEFIRNNSTSNMPQGGNINIQDTIRAANFRSRGLDGTSYRASNNTSAMRGSASTNGTIYLDPSEDGTGQIVVRALPAQVTFNSTGITTASNIHANILRATTALQGNSASNGTFYVDASQNTTGTVNIRAGSTSTFNSSGLLVTAFNVNNNLAFNSLGLLTEYGNSSITNGQILAGNSTLGAMALTTLTAGSHISVTNGAGSITIAATGFVDSVIKRNDSFFYYKGATSTFIGTDNSGSGGGIDSIRISGDTLYQCSSGTCTFVGVVNSGGGGSGTVTSFTFTDGNGFDGTVTNSTTTPTLSIDLQADHNFVSDAELAAIGSLATDYVSLSGSYSNPTWITALAWSKITGTPTTLAGYSISDAQPLDADLTAIAGLSPTNDDILQRKAGSWTNRTMAQLKTDLALTKSDVGLSNVDNTADASKNVATAATLTTARNIDNTSFNGSAPIVLPRVWQGKLAGETDTLTTGVKLTFRMPYACTVTGVKAAVNTASSSGNITIDIHENGTTIMSTNKITIEATETTSLDATQQPVLTDTSIAADALIEVEVDVAGTNAISGEVTIFYTLQ